MYMCVCVYIYIYIYILTGGFTGDARSKESKCQCRRHKRCRFDLEFPVRGHGNPLQYSCLENPMDREA